MEPVNNNFLRQFEGRETVRLRPAMYVGGTNAFGLFSLFSEVFNNAVDEHLAGRASVIDVVMYGDGTISVNDDGGGILIDVDIDSGLSFCELAMTKIALMRLPVNTYRVGGGLQGIGLACVNFLSDYCCVEVVRNGNNHVFVFKQGEKVSESTSAVGEGARRGTTITWRPDKEMFGESTISVIAVRNLLQMFSYLNRRLTINYRDETASPPHEVTFQSDRGLPEYLESIKVLLRLRSSPTLHIETAVGDVQIDIALSYNESCNSICISFANNRRTPFGGPHIDGFLFGLTRAINDRYLNGKLVEPMEICDDCLKGLTAIVSVNVFEPKYCGSTHEAFSNSEVAPIIESIVYSAVTKYFQENKSLQNWDYVKVNAPIKERSY